MNMKKLRFIGSCFAIGIIAALTMVMASCSTSTTTPLTLTSIAIAPSSPANLTVGSTQQFTASGTYSDGSTSDISYQVNWTSDTPSVATINSSGLATGVAAGTANITASLSGLTSTAVSLSVVAAVTVQAPAPTLSSIAVAPTTPDNLAVGSTQQFTASGTYSDGSTADISSQVTWNSDTPAVATISSAGLATGVAAGTANITASLSGVTSLPVSLPVVAAVAVQVPAPTLSSIVIAPASPSNLGVGSTQQFIATGTYSDNSTADISSQVTWTSDTPAVATISSAGLATGIATGTANISAAMSGVTSLPVSLPVIPALTSIAVMPVSPVYLEGGSSPSSQQFTATGTYSDGSTVDITSQATWATSDNTIATISSTGLAAGVGAGTANIKASMSGVTSQVVTITVIVP